MRLLVSFLLVFLVSVTAVAAEDIRLLTYHAAPPFIINRDNRTGLTYDLADILTNNSAGRYRFVVDDLPRKRLDLILSQIDVAVVPWANPAWFDDKKRERFLWSDGYLNDSNALLSPASNPFEYSGPQSLVGKSISGLLGSRWAGIDELVAKGQVHRINFSNYFSAMRMIQHGRSDVALIPSPIARHFTASKKLSGLIHFSSLPHSQFFRHFLIKGRVEVRDYLQSQVPYLLNSPQWKALLVGYGL